MRRLARTKMSTELTPTALGLLSERSRLDAKLWTALAAQKMSNSDVAQLRNNAVLQAVARFSILLA
jgi:SOS response regulatory protein OraA/RecX